MTTLLLIEDDKDIRELLASRLRQEGYEVALAHNCAEGRLQFEQVSPAIVLLDWRLPDGAGIDLLKQWKKEGHQTPVIMLTARVELIDKVLGLELGANDYITKPFEVPELLARIRVQERLLQERMDTQTTQSSDTTTRVIHSNGVTLHPGTFDVEYAGQKINLARKEYQLLQLLMTHPNQVFTRDELLDRVWGYQHFPETRTVDTHVMQLRQKLDPSFIETVRGIGYRWMDLAVKAT